jgi:deazaflavin-dependent oxidoreductase (nitroreductase family)
MRSIWLDQATRNVTIKWASLQDIADRQVLYLTTIGRRTGLPREIEIWFVICRERFYLFAETGEAAGWVKNIRRNPEVSVRIAEGQIAASARVLDRETERALWDEVAALANQKYGWGDGLPLEITPLPARPAHSEGSVKSAATDCADNPSAA